MGEIKGERGKASKGEGPQENLQKVQLLWICRGVGVVTQRVFRGIRLLLLVENDSQLMFDIS